MSDKNICLSRRTKTERKERGMLNVDYLVLDKHIWLWPKYQVNTSGSNNCFNVVSSTKCVSVYKNYDKVLPWRIKRWDTGKIVSLNTEKVGLSLTSMSTAVTRSSSQLDLCSFQLRKHLMLSSRLFSGSVSVTCPLIDTIWLCVSVTLSLPWFMRAEGELSVLVRMSKYEDYRLVSADYWLC